MSGIPYHAWTHAPKAQGGTDPVPFPTGDGPYAAIVWDDGATITDDTPTNISGLTDFSYGYVSDPSLLSVNLAAGRIILDPVEGPGASTLGGVWLAQLKILWVDNFAGDMWCAVNWTMGTIGIFDGIQQHIGYDKGQGATTLVTGETNTATSLVIVDEGYAGNNWVTGSFVQVSGSSQDVNIVSLTVERLEVYPAPAGVAVP